MEQHTSWLSNANGHPKNIHISNTIQTEQTIYTHTHIYALALSHTADKNSGLLALALSHTAHKNSDLLALAVSHTADKNSDLLALALSQDLADDSVVTTTK